ncbi:unknown [Staphylococcus sp. CAG:324]|nr:hypothetical protein [Staphylococcus sp.]CDC70889.1 unknown [Staphylococcus sp. CAG:324]
MNKKVIKYLSNKHNYTFLDKILLFYSSGKLKKMLIDNNATDIDIYPSIKKENSIQIYFKYYNLFVVFNFKDSYYEYCKYDSKGSPEELEQSIVKMQYNDEFAIDIFIKEFIDLIEQDERLNKSINFKKNKNKLYSVLSVVSLIIPWIILGIISLCSYLVKKDLKLGVWFGIIIIFSIIAWFIFDNKSKK